MSASEFIQNLPKAELHLHIEGTLEPELMLGIAARNALKLPFGTVSQVRQAYRFGNLQDFLDIYYRCMSVLLTEEDFFDLTRAYFDRIAVQSVRHAEIFFDPQAHTGRGVPFDTVCAGISRGLQYGFEQYRITSRLIMCFLRHLDEADAMATLEAALQHRSLIYGVGLDSGELGNPPSKFTRVFARARAAGFAVVAHAGEEGPPEYVREAVNILGVRRIDHGNRALEDTGLVAELAESQIPLTVCPLSNQKLGVVACLGRHPLREMLDAGLMITLNSDDPAFFGGYINENYQVMQDHLGIDDQTLAGIARNSFAAAFLDAGRRDELLAELDEYLANHLSKPFTAS